MGTWEVDLPSQLLQELQDSFELGPIVTDQGWRLALEHKVDRIPIGKLSVIIYADEHPPPHFLIKCSEGSRRFKIKDCTPLESTGELDKYLRNIRKWHSEHKHELVTAWNDTRPTDCPVGEYRE
jgi:Domain of unknown function (DUF4160)